MLKNLANPKTLHIFASVELKTISIMDKAEIKSEISRIDIKIRELRERVQAYQRLIELSKNEIATFCTDPYEPYHTIDVYQNELEAYKMAFNRICERLRDLKKKRNELQRGQNKC